MTSNNKDDIIIIGARPSGSIAGALLQNQGFQVTLLERQLFPRFCIGESLLPQCMEFIKQAGMMEALVNAGFQYKNGASFAYRDLRTEFCFEDKFSPGIGATFQVQRGRFDKLLADEALRMGVDIQWQMDVMADVLLRQFNSEAVDWQQDYAEPLQRGVNRFRVFVDAWDENNPYVKNARSRLDTLVELCR